MQNNSLIKAIKGEGGKTPEESAFDAAKVLEGTGGKPLTGKDIVDIHIAVPDAGERHIDRKG